MTTLNLTGQATSAGQIQTRINTLRTLMEQRREIWLKIPVEKKRAWVKSGKDPIMTVAWQVYKYLRDNFFGDAYKERGLEVDDA